MNKYPDNWKEIATKVKDAAGWRCIRCKHPNERPGAGWRIRCDEQCDLMRHPDVKGMEYRRNIEDEPLRPFYLK